MYTMLSAPARFLTAAILLTFHISALNLPLPRADYQQEIIYSSQGFVPQSPRTPEILPLGSGSEIPLDFGFQQAGNLFQIPALRAVNLFTPNRAQQPAATPGQVENYRKALEEEAREAERAENAITTEVSRDGIGGFGNVPRPRSYVSVNVEGGKQRYNYGYMLY